MPWSLHKGPFNLSYQLQDAWKQNSNPTEITDSEFWEFSQSVNLYGRNLKSLSYDGNGEVSQLNHLHLACPLVTLSLSASFIYSSQEQLQDLPTVLLLAFTNSSSEVSIVHISFIIWQAHKIINISSKIKKMALFSNCSYSFLTCISSTKKSAHSFRKIRAYIHIHYKFEKLKPVLETLF